jgi:hypothetical protein
MARKFASRQAEITEGVRNQAAVVVAGEQEGRSAGDIAFEHGRFSKGQAGHVARVIQVCWLVQR